MDQGAGNLLVVVVDYSAWGIDFDYRNITVQALLEVRSQLPGRYWESRCVQSMGHRLRNSFLGIGSRSQPKPVTPLLPSDICPERTEELPTQISIRWRSGTLLSSG